MFLVSIHVHNSDLQFWLNSIYSEREELNLLIDSSFD